MISNVPTLLDRRNVLLGAGAVAGAFALRNTPANAEVLVAPTTEIFVMVAASPGQHALDAVDSNARTSPFSDAIAAELAIADQELSVFDRNVRRRVVTATRGKQLPWSSTTLTAPLKLDVPEDTRSKAALLIANAEYRAQRWRLKHPANDARLVATRLGAAGFSTTTLVDQTHAQIIEALEAFAKQSAAIKAIFYSGHGETLAGQFGALPIDVKIGPDERELQPADLVGLGAFIRTVGTSTKAGVVIIDSDNSEIDLKFTKLR